jgi:hypothetical protein
MNYTLDRFAAPPDRTLVEIIQDGFAIRAMTGNLGRLLERDAEKKRKHTNAKRAMMAFVSVANKLAPSEEVQPDLFGKFLNWALKKVGKFVVKQVVKPILRFAGRMAWQLLRFAAQTLLRYVLIPVIEFVVALAVANPITAAVVGVAALIGGGYAVWKKWFSNPSEVSQVEVDTTNVAQQATDVQAAGQAQVAGSTNTQVYETGARDYLTRAKELVVGRRTRGPSGPFRGFGNDVDGYIREASAMFPILPVDVFRGFVKMEAGWTGAMSPTGAIGTGQFVQGTWDAMARTAAGQRIGMTVIGRRFRTPDDPRFDKRINTLATGLLASQNAQMLVSAGLPVTGENLYMMHNIGPGIIPVMKGLPASPQTLTAMRQNGMTNAMSAQDFLEWQKGRFRNAYSEANSSTAVAAEQTQMTPGRAVSVSQEIADKGKVVPKTAQLAPPGNTGQDLIRGPGRTIVRA